MINLQSRVFTLKQVKEDKVFNQTHVGVRSTVERVFGVLKQHYAMGKARYNWRLISVSILYDCKSRNYPSFFYSKPTQAYFNGIDIHDLTAYN